MDQIGTIRHAILRILLANIPSMTAMNSFTALIVHVILMIDDYPSIHHLSYLDNVFKCNETLLHIKHKMEVLTRQHKFLQCTVESLKCEPVHQNT